MDYEGKATSFDDVYKKEWEEIRGRRLKHIYDGEYYDACSGVSASTPKNLVGLALSGGGIRSATFCLGFLQGMNKLKLLRIFDYLSTVSGGGYVGGWWSAWLAREEVSAASTSDFTPEPFRPEDIKNPDSLIAKLREKKDAISVALEAGFDSMTIARLHDYKEGSSPHDREKLVKELVGELNLAVKNYFLFTPLWCEINREKGEGGVQPTIEELSPEKYALWVNRTLLEEAYPYELKGIFPPEERLESDRSQQESDETERRWTEGSSSAWKDPIHHLRLFASYLTPRRGALSADTWRAVSVITRNLTLTWLILLPVLLAIILVGQLYFQVMPELIGTPSNDPTAARFSYLMIPLIAIAGWIIVIAITWLVFSREKFTINAFIVHLVCICAVITLLVTGTGISTNVERNTIRDLWSDPNVRVGVGVWVFVTLVMLIQALWPSSMKGLPRTKPELRKEWRRQILRNKISRTHTKLMTWLVVIFLLLLIAGFGHSVVEGVFGFKTPKSVLGLLPLFSAIAGSIFTALKASPTGGGDERAREPSWMSRAVFAVTPGLMVILLALGAAWAGEELLTGISGHYEQVQPLVAVAILYGILLCFILAIYEMEWVKLKLSWPLSAFCCWVVLNFYWASTGILEFAGKNDLHLLGFIGAHDRPLYLIPLILAVVPTILFFKIVGDRRRKGSIKKIVKSKAYALRLFASVFPLLFIAGFLAVTFFSSQEPTQRIEDLYPLLAIISGLAGSMILFRLVVVRVEGKERYFKLRSRWQRKKRNNKAESSWWLTSICLVSPILVGYGLHTLFLADKHAPFWREVSVMGFFILLLAALPYLLLMSRPLVSYPKVVDTQSKQATEGNFVAKITNFLAIDNNPLSSFKTVTCVGIGGFLAVGFTINNVSQASDMQFSAGYPLSLPAIAFAFIMSVVLFELSLAQAQGGQIGQQQLVVKPGKPQAESHGKYFLMTLAAGCILAALLVGYLSSIILSHIQGLMIDLVNPTAHQQLAGVALIGLVTCFTLIGFEVWWGKGNNRRSLWLIACTYLVLFALFTVGLIPSYRGVSSVQKLLTVFGLLAAALVWIVALGWMVDPNMVSMHQFYKGRLVRAYLGASNARRFDQDKDIAESVAGDDVPLKMLRNCERGAPYHLVNTTLNLVAGRDLATAQRSASSFVLSKQYCGSLRTSYRTTSEYMDGWLTLGTAVAASGAAVSPSMGAKKPTAALAMLMTLLNVRLGYWAPTPDREKWKLSQPRLWPFYLLREFFSQTNDLSSYCYLTDGGHFDNTGLYSLVERGCRFIVLIDCAADPEPCFQDLGDAIRRCRIDFGTEIDLNIEPLMKNPEKEKVKKAESGFIVGTLNYSRKHADMLGGNILGQGEDEKSRTGIIIYFKPSIIGMETADVQQYAIENGNFPQQTTANQWFDEAQFESYRRLGQIAAERAFSDLEPVSQAKNRAELLSDDIITIFRETYRQSNPKKDIPI